MENTRNGCLGNHEIIRCPEDISATLGSSDNEANKSTKETDFNSETGIKHSCKQKGQFCSSAMLADMTVYENMSFGKQSNIPLCI